MYSRSLSALAFVADFLPVAPEFHQRTHRVRLRNLGTTDKKIISQNQALKNSESTFSILLSDKQTTPVSVH